MNCLFIIQGEGRGHMTQALALADMLRSAGHDVAAALVGRSRRRELPAFFSEKIGTPVHLFDSPNFVADPNNRSIRVLPTLFHTARNARSYRESLGRIGAYLHLYQPDLVVNFYEPLAGVYYRRFRPSVPMVCIGHQYLCHHPSFPFPEGHPMDRRSLQWFTDVTAFGAVRRLALSFTPLPDYSEKRVSVVPPLLRPAVFRQPRDVMEPFFLVYLLNAGYAEAIIRWHEAHPEVVLHCFWDHRSAPDVLPHDRTLTFHRLNDTKFLSMMARCRGLICTAGFESVCEAMYLGKPTLMVPVEGHFEQQCNALDAVAAGAGLSATHFDIDRFLAFVPEYRSPAVRFRRWTADAPRLFLDELEAAAMDRRVPAEMEVELV